MTLKETITQKIYEALTMNRFSAETYTVKIKNQPCPFVGIPLISSNNPAKFSMKITNNDDFKGVYEGYVDDIEVIEKR
ncbi:MAG: hypothetical protein PF503_01535 [Desulfobacula sp.]|jgi:hypothetical protein|nr:hypothetical protein [Desulfobacula sp.]